MKNYWYKILGLLLLLYALIGGMLIPLKAGLVDVTPDSIQTGSSVDLTIEGYNTNFDQAEKLTVWLKGKGEVAIKAREIKPNDATSLVASFKLPNASFSENKIEPLTLVVNSKTDGISLLPNHVILKSGAVDSTNTATWGTIGNMERKEGITFPYRNILVESIRNSIYHIPLWFAMVIIFLIAVINSIKYLNKPNINSDTLAVGFTEVGILLGILGTATGAIWAKHTWGQYWSWDIKQNVSAIALLIYLAYFVLRGSFEDKEKAARLSAVYNIFAFAAMIPLLFVIPRLTASLHPGNGGNPGMGGEDLDNTLRMFLYPAVIGWILVGVWMANLRSRYLRLKDKFLLRINEQM